MTGTFRMGALGVATLLSIGCGETPTGESRPRQIAELNGLRLELVLDKSVIPVGDSATVTMRLHNDNADTVRLSYGSSCQILPYVENAVRAVQYPGGGNWACLAVLTALDVPGRGSVERTLVLRGVESSAGLYGAVLTPGRYRVYALTDVNWPAPQPGPANQLRSPTVNFEVR